MVEKDDVTVVEQPRRRWVIPAMLLLLVLGLFWYKTNSWPVAAFVNGVPVTRFELDQELYKQGGAEVLDGMITERLIKSEVARKNVQVSDEDVNSRLEEIKTNLGESYELALSAQGLTEDKLKSQITTQLQIEKMLSDGATVSAEEVDAVAENFPSREEAEKFALQQKIQGMIQEWIVSLREKAKIYVVGQQPQEIEQPTE